MQDWLSTHDERLLLRIKAVPGASRDTIAGLLGDQLKIRIIAPPEGGKANQAIIGLLCEQLGIPRGQLTLISGHTARDKLIQIDGLDSSQARARLGIDD